MDEVTFRTLLFDSEGPRLDFKRESYKFVGATDGEKSELLKDLLALANAWRSETAYIVTGVVAHADGRRDLLGVEPSSHPDDASVQQFVNGKLQRMLQFSYAPFSFEGKSFGIYEVPRQQRPTVALKRYGVVDAGAVYFRKGSSTAIASADQIAQMGADDQRLRTETQPSLEVFLADVERRTIHGSEVKLETQVHAAHNPAELPDFSDAPPQIPIGPGLSFVMPTGLSPRSARAKFWRELADYVRDRSRFGSFGIVVTNTSSIVANRVRVEIRFAGADLDCRYAENMPEYPESHFDLLAPHIPPYFQTSSVEGEPRIRQTDTEWIVSFEFGSIRPRESVWSSEPVHIAVSTSQTLIGDVACFASNLASPISAKLKLGVVAATRARLTIDDLESFDEAHALEEARSKGLIDSDHDAEGDAVEEV